MFHNSFKPKMVIASVLGFCSVFTVSGGQNGDAEPSMNSAVWDENSELDFFDETRKKPAIESQESQVRLSNTKDSQGGAGVSNTKTVRELLGPKLKSIAVLYVAPFETMTRFFIARDAISDALQKSPKTLYRYEPWANAVRPDFIGRINYSDGKTGELALAYGYLCFQDHEGKHWWARFTMPSELNLKSVDGTLRFKEGNGYYLEQPDGHHIWLRASENKILVGQLQALLNKSVIATGELRRIPKNVVTSIPAGGDYLVDGFTIAPAHSTKDSDQSK